MRIGFIITAPYQLFHFGRIAEHFPYCAAYLEIREEQFGLTTALVEKHLPNAEVAWVNTARLSRIDGLCDVLVCHTPVPIMQFFSKSLVVAQQYSLAKERYQYDVWRAQANLNLMYGPYSVSCVSGFANAVAVGNPLLDSVYSHGRPPQLPDRASHRPRVLYMPTYGDLSDKRAVLESLVQQNVELTVKLHHAEKHFTRSAEGNALRIVHSDVDPIELIREHDVVVSDYSGAIYDALAARRPVLIAEGLNERSRDLRRLSDQDRSHAEIESLVERWHPSEPVADAYAAAFDKLSGEARFYGFLERYFANLGEAGKACAAQIVQLVEHGEPEGFAVNQVRAANRSYILENRKLRAQLAAYREGSLRDRIRRIRAMPPRLIAVKGVRWGLRRVPGGNTALDMMRKVRAHHHGGGPQRDARPNAGDRWSLPLRPVDRRRAVLQVLERALRKQGIEYRTYCTASNAYCAVPQAELENLCKTINSLGRDVAGLAVWLASGAYVDNARPAESLSLSVLAEYESVIVGVPYEDRHFSLGRRAGVEVLIVEPRDARVVAKRWVAEKADWTHEFGREEAAAIKSRAGSAVATLERRHVLEGEPIDVVYTWVDSSDTHWRDAQREWAAKQHVELQASSNEERFINRDELLYSLRSLWLYAPFVRNIYIVTAGHKPQWLDTRMGNIFVVPHEDIFPDTADLPTFNSHAIEACLHRIPGLSEHFLYFNDDVFVGRETSIETFFTRAGLMKSRLSPSGFTTAAEPDLSAIPTDWASYNAVRLMLRDFDMLFDRRVKHVPMPLKRSLLEEIEQRYAEEVAATRSSRFRSSQDLSLPSMLAHYYGIATGRAVEWDGKPREYAYADTGRRDFVNRLEAIRRDRPTFVCLNVTRHVDIDLPRQASLLRKYLNEAYPIPSPYEKRSKEKRVEPAEIGNVVVEGGSSD